MGRIDDLEGLLALSWSWRPALMMLEAHKAGVFDAAAGGWKSADRIAGALGADPRATGLLLLGLCGVGLMEKRGGEFRNSPVVERSLVKASPDYRGYALELDRRAVSNWSRISEVAISGAPIPKPETTVAEQDAWQLTFIRAMDNIASTSVGPLLAAMPLADGQRLLDIGCGPAKYLVEILLRYPRSSAVAFDRPNSQPVARAAAEKAGVETRFAFRGGDLTRESFTAEGPFDGILISQVVHILSDEGVADLMVRAAQALTPGGFLAIHDMVLGPDEDPGPAAIFAVQMMLGTAEGKVYTKEEIIALMRSAGIEYQSGAPTDERSLVIIGV
ncbi:MAG: acetylserotonin O-methyltransferase, partial [Nitrospinota bacterium]|nr:acetylserotonin O-methyltransferase [Nitrospinota bacterium]